MLDEEIENCNIATIKEIGAYHPLIKSFSKYLNVQYTKKYYLKTQYTKMINASYWLVNCVDERYVQYCKLIVIIVFFIEKT